MPTREPSHFSRHYTPAEARALLPEIRHRLDRLSDCQRQVQAGESSLGVLLSQHRDIGGKVVNDLLRRLAEAKEILREFASRQIQVKDIERGLIDFPSWREGREVFLCWEKDEADIEHWHDLETGYAGREPL